ncbi:MAG TPA: hypothetical protein VGN86_10715 [Pyrinomonadaceae bacterium]|jgi:hypothetical protein|nr:hypothetical protein [Pyrinomonadaceae bacterium]
MKSPKKVVSALLSLLMLFETAQIARACGPEYIEPIFVFTTSPDLPFKEFTAGKIGIVRPSFGKKTLVIAYRYLNGGSFSPDEQDELVAALQGLAPEENDSAAIKYWVDARKELVTKDEPEPAIYSERHHGEYDFFPNCARNAFEVASATLKERVGRYGDQDKNVRDWLAAQDSVFENCAGGSSIPSAARPDQPLWLRKDRDYQIAAAYFYSLKFDEARLRFAAIAADAESPWQETADYLVARTLVREASLTRDPKKQQTIYDQAQLQLQMLLGRNSSFNKAEHRLEGLIKFRVQPADRLRELAQVLAGRGWDDNLRQNLIDYNWLIDKFQAEQKEVNEVATASVREKQPESPEAMEIRKKYEKIHAGELIEIWLYPRSLAGELDYQQRFELAIKPEVTKEEVFNRFVEMVGRPLRPDELNDLGECYREGQSNRIWYLSPNRKWDDAAHEYQECYECEKIPLKSYPEFLQSDDLTDWIMTLQTDDPAAYGHALRRWRATDSPSWLIAALSRANKSSRQLTALIRAGEKLQRDEPAYASVAFHLVRLKAAMGNVAEARKLIDEIISWQEGLLPVSTQNQFLELRMQLALNLTEYLRYAARKPVMFYEYGRFGTLNDLLTVTKSLWYPDGYEEKKEEYETATEDRFKKLLPWQDRAVFDSDTATIINWHFPLETLFAAAHNSALPDYLRRQFALAVWTRALILENKTVEEKIAPDLIKMVPELGSLFSDYQKAETRDEKERAALFILIKFQNFSPYVREGLPTFTTAEEEKYYLEEAWWCPPGLTEYGPDGQEVPRVVAKPSFLSAADSEAARREREKLLAIGDPKSYFGKRVLAWAKAAPEDRRIPEALFIAARANDSYKYGCSSWDHDEETKSAAEKLLRERYGSSVWAGKLEPEPENK